MSARVQTQPASRASDQLSQAFLGLGFDECASSRVHNPKGGSVTKWCDSREMERASLCDLRAKNPKDWHRSTKRYVFRRTELRGVASANASSDLKPEAAG